jgi:hypothetical protein
MNVDQEKVSLQIRAALENRLAQVLDVERADLPVLSLAEIVSLLFCFHGHWNIFGGFRETASSIRALVGDELFWRRPESTVDESETPTTVH